MPTRNLSSMSVDALLKLKADIEKTLTSRAVQLRKELSKLGLSGWVRSTRVMSPHQIDVAQQLKCDVRPSTKQLFGRHLTYQCAPLLVEIQAVRRASPILQATERADLPSTAHPGTREFPSGRAAQLLATSDRVHRLTRVAVPPTVSRPTFR
jgi:hypothetical protein